MSSEIPGDIFNEGYWPCEYPFHGPPPRAVELAALKAEVERLRDHICDCSAATEGAQALGYQQGLDVETARRRQNDR